MKLYPLVFSFRDLITGNGFVAGVAMDGQVVLSHEDDGDVWMYGVQPGGIAGGDTSREAAFAEFKKSYLSVLYDIAAESSSFVEFEQQVTSFFNTVNTPNEADWQKALAEVREKNISLTDLQTVKAESKTPRLIIQNVAADLAKPEENRLDEIAEAA